MVGELQFLPDVLPPGGVQGDQFREEVSPHGSFDHVGIVEWLLVVIALHTTTGSLHVLAVVDQNLIQLTILITDLLPVKQDTAQIDDSSIGEKFRHREDPTMSLPANVSNGVLDEAEEILEATLLVSFIDALLAQSELLQLPIILLAHRPESPHSYR